MRFLAITALLSAAALAQAPSEVEAVVATSLGTFRFEFAPEAAPKHVEHFLNLARQGFYDGGAFHRVVPYGIIQGGDPLLKDGEDTAEFVGLWRLESVEQRVQRNEARARRGLRRKHSGQAQ